MPGHGYCFSHIFFHPDFNRWSRSFTGSADTFLCPVADCTASGEFRPALKTFDSVVRYHYSIAPLYCNPQFFPSLPVLTSLFFPECAQHLRRPVIL